MTYINSAVGDQAEALDSLLEALEWAKHQKVNHNARVVVKAAERRLEAAQARLAHAMREMVDGGSEGRTELSRRVAG